MLRIKVSNSEGLRLLDTRSSIGKTMTREPTLLVTTLTLVVLKLLSNLFMATDQLVQLAKLSRLTSGNFFPTK